MRYFHRRVIEWALAEDTLQGRMAFIAGPRQIGKTTAVQHFLAQQRQPRLYYNWDTPTVKRRYAANPVFFVDDLPAERPQVWVALDEIHKYPKWKNLLKGYHDEWRQRIRFIVTGSARLDLFRKSGDSLLGRYFLFRMLPLGISEVMSGTSSQRDHWVPGQDLAAIPAAASGAAEAVDSLLQLAGYPEPFTVGTQAFCTRWREHHVSLILQEDLRDLTRIVHIRKLETLLYLLPERVGAPLSLNALRQPLESAHGTIRAWLDALKVVYLIFSIKPWTARLSRSVLKEEKVYFWDWGMVTDPGARFENFLAVQLQRAIASWNERGEGPFSLYFLRTKDGHEVDFVIADRHRVWLLIEAKASDTTLSQTLPVLQAKVQARLALQVINRPGICERKGTDVYMVGVDRFLSLLP